ncbi:MAG TPA: hypothetical protein VN018_10735, partial [Brevundimonas sp.]|nr:hypothetical protein [Brevundimonas sp.]
RRGLNHAGEKAGQRGGHKQHSWGLGEKKLSSKRAAPVFPSHFSDETESCPSVRTSSSGAFHADANEL